MNSTVEEAQQQEGSFPLPVDILAHVLRFLDFKECLGSCALVSHYWHAAAAIAAAAHIKLGATRQDTLTGLQDWVAAYGSCGVLDINVSAPYDVDPQFSLQLPVLQLPKLESLALSNLELLEYMGSSSDSAYAAADVAGAAADADTGPVAQQQAAPSASAAATQEQLSSSSSVSRRLNPLAALTSLTRLSLDFCTLSGRMGNFGSLSTLTKLQQLQLMGQALTHRQSPAISNELFSALPHMMQLTHLTLDAEFQEDAPLAALSSLRQLQELYLFGGWRGPYPSLEPVQLPVSLTMLNAKGGIWSGSAAILVRLRGLQHLVLHDVGEFNAALLSRLQQLRHFEVQEYDCSYLDLLLAALPHLQQLQDVTMTYEAALGAPEPQLVQFSALLASSQLTCLDMTNSVLPAGVAKHMFPAGRQLLNLIKLQLGYDMERISNGNPCAFGPGDVCSLVRCCPALRVLDLAGAVLPGVQLTALAQLSGLTNLTFGGAALNDVVAAEVLAQLTGLYELDIVTSYYFTDAGLCQLTKLTSLDMLYVDGGCDLSEAFSGYGLELRNEVGLPPVWRQLEQLCKESSTCLRVMLEQRDSELAAEKELVSSYKQLALLSAGTGSP